jgi:hypothetical protein
MTYFGLFGRGHASMFVFGRRDKATCTVINRRVSTKIFEILIILWATSLSIGKFLKFRCRLLVAEKLQNVEILKISEISKWSI